MATFPKDLVSENNHPLNLVECEAIDEVSVTRPPIFEVYMRMAEELAKRSTCARLRGGSVTLVRKASRVPVVADGDNVLEMPVRDDGPHLKPRTRASLGQLLRHSHIHLEDRWAGDREPMCDLRQIAHPGQHLSRLLP